MGFFFVYRLLLSPMQVFFFFVCPLDFYSSVSGVCFFRLHVSFVFRLPVICVSSVGAFCFRLHVVLFSFAY